MRKLLLFLVLAAPAMAQLINAKQIQSIPVKLPLSCSDGYVITYVAANSRFECLAGGGGGPTDATYITQTPNSSLSAEQALSALATGILKNTTATGVLSIAMGNTDFLPVNNPTATGTFTIGTSVSGIFTALRASDTKNTFNVGSSISDFSSAMQNGFVFQTGPTNFFYHGTENNVPSAVQIALETTASGDYGLTVLSFTTGGGTPIGLNIDAGNSGASDIANSQGIAAAVAVLSTGNITDAQVYSAQAGFHNSTGRITNYIGFDTQDFSEGTGTNIAFRSQQSAGVGNWAFYGAGTAASHFGGNVDITGSITPTVYATATNCASAASPAVCAAAPAGAVAIPTGITSVALVVNTTAVTANSRITLLSDDSLTIPATTCNSTLATLVGGLAVTARTAGTSFTITYNGTIATNPLCVSYSIVN